MNEEQLQTLRAARLSGKDEAEPGVRLARAAATLDPGIGAQLASERVTDLSMQQALDELKPPAHLEASLLSVMRATLTHAEADVSAPHGGNLDAASTTAPPQKVVLLSSRRRWLAAISAAAAAITVGALWSWRRASTLTLDKLSAELASIAETGVTLSLVTTDKAEVAGWLRDHAAPRAASFPVPLDALPRIGCHLYDIQGRPVSLECLLLPGGAELHLFSISSAELFDPPVSGAVAHIDRHGPLTRAAWTRGEHTMLLFSEATPERVRSLFA